MEFLHSLIKSVEPLQYIYGMVAVFGGVAFTNRDNSNGTNGSIIGGLTSQFSMFDSNGAFTPAGSKNMAITLSASATWSAGIATFAPIVSPAPTPTLIPLWSATWF